MTKVRKAHGINSWSLYVNVCVPAIVGSAILVLLPYLAQWIRCGLFYSGPAPAAARSASITASMRRFLMFLTALSVRLKREGAGGQFRADANADETNGSLVVLSKLWLLECDINSGDTIYY